MKKLLSTLLLFVSIFAFGQTVPQGINYQAVAIDESGKPIPGVDIVGSPIDDAEIGIRISILENSPTGAVLYQEEHEVLTDQYGMFNLVIGQGLQVSPDPFSSIDWIGDKYLQVELSVDNNGDFKLSAVQQLMSVPYAFLADRALNVDDADADASNEIQNLSVSGDSLTISAGNTVVLPTSNDLDKDPTNELQQLFVQNDSLFLTADTSGIGYALDPNNRRTEIIDFNKTNCFPIPRVDSLNYNPSGYGGQILFIEKRNGNVLFSHDEQTIVVDSTGNRIAEYSLRLIWSLNVNNNLVYGNNHIPIFNNRMVDASIEPFCGLRTNNINGDTLGLNIINDTNYFLLLDNTGNYLTHIGIDSLINIGINLLKIQAINTSSLYFSYWYSNNYFIGEIDIASGLMSFPSSIQNSFPLFTLQNEYWVKTTLGSDSCLVVSKEINGALSPVYYTDTTQYNYFYYLLNTKIYPERAFAYPTKTRSALLNIADPKFYPSLYGRHISYIDTAFIIHESPTFTDNYQSYNTLPNTYLYPKDSIFYFVHRIPLADLQANRRHPTVRYQNKYFIASKDINQRLQFSYNLTTQKISPLLIEHLNYDGIDNLARNYQGEDYHFVIYQDFGDLIVSLMASNSYCLPTNPPAGLSPYKFYIMKKDDFESYFIH